jgi:2-polyprenyl-3-methyl-5-hydroxy-6-metoxy-1,4-benzoquinol methylase
LKIGSDSQEDAGQGRPRGDTYSTLVRLGLVMPERVSVFSTRTRDRHDVEVLRDDVSKVIFIDDFYVGDQEYRGGGYRDEAPSDDCANSTFEDRSDTQRRLASFRQFVVGKKICDFGCGAGAFLREAQPQAAMVCGVELQNDLRAHLNQRGIRCAEAIGELDIEFDSIFLFHTMEHLPDPLKTLRQIRQALRPNGEGRIIVEVPHARDFLIDTLALPEFISFTLWSQHLILHTRVSLAAFLGEAGFRDIRIVGVQRYGLANHLQWLKEKRPGGHKSALSIIETEALTVAYAEALARLDQTDTLVAIATC